MLKTKEERQGPTRKYKKCLQHVVQLVEVKKGDHSPAGGKCREVVEPNKTHTEERLEGDVRVPEVGAPK